MKKVIKLVFITLLLTLNTACPYFGGTDDDINNISSNYEPVIIDRETFENSTELVAGQPIEKSGKIYVKDNYLIINEPNKGFHIYDNTNPENPINIKFLKVLGSSDLSIKNNIVYANNAVDLIALTINENFETITVTKRVRNVFPELTSPDGFFSNSLSNSEIVIDWNIKN